MTGHNDGSKEDDRSVDVDGPIREWNPASPPTTSFGTSLFVFCVVISQLLHHARSQLVCCSTRIGDGVEVMWHAKHQQQESRDSSRKLSHHQRNKRKSQLKRQTRRLSLNLDDSRCSTNLGQPTPNSPLAVRSVRNCLQKSENWKRRSPEIGSGAKMMASIGLSIAEQSGLVVDDWRAASPKTMRTITQSMTSFPLPNVPEITLTSQRDGTVVDEWLEAQIEKMVELIGRTGFFRARELVFAADCKGSVSC
ncbi:hypothetical protein BLNAU_18204 [Blattamonas nauphoetae]|uniref:Uncharacterized protein n=1 Tax=Blattamonas nauphoetae TaxID=2049346 RepID=A0ABQ9X5D8_9EUKA|nr:hypothetical protein BLNAU_18204 [Blattamonas nauphoetae]